MCCAMNYRWQHWREASDQDLWALYTDMVRELRAGRTLPAEQRSWAHSCEKCVVVRKQSPKVWADSLSPASGMYSETESELHVPPSWLITVVADGADGAQHDQVSSGSSS